MSLHQLIEPAGTLATGWKLVPQDPRKTADIRNPDECPSCDVDEGDRSAPTQPHTRSKWEVGEVG